MPRITVKDYYDNEGWNFTEGKSRDSIINENHSSVASAYVTNVRLRIGQQLGSGGSLLDIGCGPIQYPEYVKYSDNFQLRICVDLSEKALSIAEKKIGLKGRYLVGDYLTLSPLKYGPFDGATLINVLYHVDKDKQFELVKKILSELNPGKKLVVVYSNSRTFSGWVTKTLLTIKRFILLDFIRNNGSRRDNPIYFYTHKSSFWKQFADVADIKILAWRTFSIPLEKLLFKEAFFGAFALKFLFRVESLTFWAKCAQYPMIVLTKKSIEFQEK